MRPEVDFLGLVLWALVVAYLGLGVGVATFACEKTMEWWGEWDKEDSPIILFEFIVLIPLWPTWFVYMFLHWIFKDKQ